MPSITGLNSESNSDRSPRGSPSFGSKQGSGTNSRGSFGLGSKQGSGTSSRGGGTPGQSKSNVVLNYASMSHSCTPEGTAAEESGSKYFKLLKRLAVGYSFTKSGPVCYVHKNSHKHLFSFPFTEVGIRNACFLFVDNNNFEQIEEIVSNRSAVPDCTQMESPPEFRS